MVLMDITILCFFHIIFINSLSIIVDYWVLKAITKSHISILLVAVAGCTSLFLSVILTNWIVDYCFDEQWFGFDNGVVKKQLFITGAAIFILITIIIECCCYCLATKNIKASVKSTMIANLVTNIPVAAFYYLGDLYYAVVG